MAANAREIVAVAAKREWLSPPIAAKTLSPPVAAKTLAAIAALSAPPSGVRHTLYRHWQRCPHSFTRKETAEYCLFYRALLQKRPIILRSLLDPMPTLFSLLAVGGNSHALVERRNTAEYCLFYRALLQKRPIDSLRRCAEGYRWRSPRSLRR